MRVLIIDADFLTKKKHKFPNLASMKISAFHKVKGDTVELLKGYYDDLFTPLYSEYDKIYISKVFTETKVDETLLKLPNVTYGGTGFYYDKAEPLPDEIEHCCPDYELYTGIEGKYYNDYAIGFVTRGCFRRCEFCVNKNSNGVVKHADISEFIGNKKKICLLDDNFFGLPTWETELKKIIEYKLPFQFKQGLDARIMTNKHCELLFNSKYDGSFIFAFDNVADYEIIENKLKMFTKFKDPRKMKFYLFCGFDRQGKWDGEFWQNNLKDLIKRVKLLKQYNAHGYCMRFERSYTSEYKTYYSYLANYINNPNIYIHPLWEYAEKTNYQRYKKQVLDELWEIIEEKI